MSIEQSMFKEIFKEFSEAAGAGSIKSVVEDLGSDVNHYYCFGSPVIDIPFSGNGIPSGKILELYGWQSAGKSTLSLEICKAFDNYWSEYNKKNPKKPKKYVTLWLEAESALDKIRAKWMGCNIENWLINEADTVEKTEEMLLAILKKAVENDVIVMIVWDTIAATPMLAEQTGEGSRMANKATYVRSFFRKITPLIGKTDSTLILVNQLTKNFETNAADETSIPAIKFYASIRCRITKREEDRTVTPTGDEVTRGIVSELKFDKNKLIQRGQKALVVIDNERGFDLLETSMRYLKKAKLASVKGAGWTELNIPERVYNPDNKEPIGYTQIKFQGIEKLKEIIETKYPHAKDWIDYLIYLNYTTVSPLIKVKIINKVWEYENLFFGEKKTFLTEDEKTAASMLYKELESDEDEKMSAPTKSKKEK